MSANEIIPTNEIHEEKNSVTGNSRDVKKDTTNNAEEWYSV